MNALRRLLQGFLDWPMLSSVLGTLFAIVAAMAVSIFVYRSLQGGADRLSPGPVFVFGALVIATVYAVSLGYMTLIGKTFEQGVIEWLAGFTRLPLDSMGGYQRPMLLQLFYLLLQGCYLLIVAITAWLIGLFDQDPGGVAREIEEALGTSYAMRFYRLCGYHRPDAPEKRFHAYASKIAKAMKWAKWLSLPAVFTGAIPVSLWIVGAIMYDGLSRNLTAPPAAPEEEAREDEEAAGAVLPTRDPAVLVTALRDDPRGPMLDILAGGSLHGRAEHCAERTRVKEESHIVADLLQSLGIEGFYVHQEAAAEAILNGKEVLMETPPLSGRRTLCDVLAMRTVLLGGGTVLYLSPTPAESARRAKAFVKVANESNWRWAIFHHDIAHSGRDGLDLKLRQPQIVFTTPDRLHDDICRLHHDWDYFLQSLALIAAIDLDRYTGPRGTNLMYLMRRLDRIAHGVGATPRVLATVAPYGPDVQGFAERLIGRPLTVIGTESDSRGAPAQYVVVAQEREPRALHAAVSSRGVAIACGYDAEIWGHGDVLTDFEQDQQVNKVLLEFSRAVVAAPDDTDLRFDTADALAVRLSSDKAAMIPFFTRHVGRATLGVPSLAAVEVGKRSMATDRKPALPFSGFERHEDAVDIGKESARLDESGEPLEEETGEQTEEPIELEDVSGDGQHAPPDVQIAPDMAVSIWLADREPFAELIARNPRWVHPLSVHDMLKTGSKLVAAPDNASITVRHLLCAAAERPITRSEAASLFSATALDMVLSAQTQRDFAIPRLIQRPRLSLDDEGQIQQQDELVLDGEIHTRRGSTQVASIDTAKLVNRSGGETVLETDAVRILAVAYPGRVLVRSGRRYRVLLPDEQERVDDGIVWAEPERRRIRTSRVRELELAFEGEGHELRLGGSSTLRFHHAHVDVTETVIGVRQSHGLRQGVDTLFYDSPISLVYNTRGAIVHLPPAPGEALEALERLVRVTLPAFVRHSEEDVDVVCVGGEQPLLAFVDRHPGGVGFARAVTSDVLRHVMYWGKQIATSCPNGSCDDGCSKCVRGAPRLTPDSGPLASRKAVAELLSSILE